MLVLVLVLVPLHVPYSTANDRETQTPVATAFETALANDGYLYIVSKQLDQSFDAGDGVSCQLQIGDILQKDTLIAETGLVTLKVKVSQPGDCKAGTLVTLTVQQLQEIYDDFQQSMDTGAQSLASDNQPTDGSGPNP